jgi:hypothetical protein
VANAASPAWLVAWWADVAVRDRVWTAVRWVAIGAAAAVIGQYVATVWNNADPPRDVHMTADVTIEYGGQRVLNLFYGPINTRRCPSTSSHFLDQREGDEPWGKVIRRWPVMDHQNGLVPVDRTGEPVNQKFEVSQDIPTGLPPGTYFHTSTRSVVCDVIPGLPRHPAPTWTAPVRVVVP